MADVLLPLGSRTVFVPQLPASHSNSSQRLSWQRLSNSFLLLTSPAYIISARTAQKTPFFCCSTIVAVETGLFTEPLLSNCLFHCRCLETGLQATILFLFYYPSKAFETTNTISPWHFIWFRATTEHLLTSCYIYSTARDPVRIFEMEATVTWQYHKYNIHSVQIISLR
jgi:hypothetical protein